MNSEKKANFDSLRVTHDFITENITRVWWQWGHRNQGIIDVRLPDNVHQRGLVAELNAMHYLLEIERISGDSASGQYLNVYCSFDVIKKNIKNYERNRLSSLLTFLRGRFFHANYNVDEDKAYRHHKAVENVVEIEGRDYLGNMISNQYEEWFEITQHALDRTMQRWNIGEENTEMAWRKIMLIFQDSQTVEYVHEIKKEERFFYNKPQKVLFVTKDENPSVIVTIVYAENMKGYKKKPN